MAKSKHLPKTGVASKQQAAGQAEPVAAIRGVWLLADLAGALVASDGPTALLEEAVQHALEMFRCSSGAVWLIEADGERPRAGPSAGKGRLCKAEELLDASAVRETVMTRRLPLVMPQPGDLLGGAFGSWQGLAVIPIAGADRVLGFLAVGDLAAGDGFTETDKALMAALGSMVAVALETAMVHARFREETNRRLSEVVSELSRATAELQRFKPADELFNAAPVGIVGFDREFRVTTRNSASERLWPDDRSIFSAARHTDLASRDPDWEAALRDVVRMHRSWSAEGITWQRPGSSEPLRLNLTCSPMPTDKPTGVAGILVVEDVTQRVQMERRLAASERMAGVGRLAAMVAHEINNPLDGIIRLVNLARRVGAEAGQDRIEKYLAEAHKGLMRMVLIVRDLLDFSRSAAGSVEAMPVKDLLAEAVRNMSAAAEKGGVTVAVGCDDSVPQLRSSSLYQVVLNLLKNAIEATPPGGHVDVRARCESDVLVIEVTDTGPGIPPEVLGRLFEPFYSLKATGKGTGLGLVISRDLVEKQGGTLTAANRPEGGAMFTVRIPLAPGSCACPGT